jgi:hypothetical protein
MTYRPLRDVPTKAGYGPGDVLVLFGELFGRGYANGIVDEARRAGMAVVGATVGRIVNVPLEAGFDLEAADGGAAPVEQLKGAKPDAWESIALDWDAVARSREVGARRFERAVAAFVTELSPLVPPGANVLFVHTMAGGFPRARVYMPLMTRLFRGVGEKFLSSREFWASDLGKLWAMSFDEVTGRTFERLVAATEPFRRGRRVSYVAYGYHGCEVLVGGAYTWQTYVPYLQGWAKMLLERCAEEAWQRGARCAVFNCPEIWTNSSALFLGVEVSLYPLLQALSREGAGTAAADAVRARLKEGASIEALLARAEEYLASPLMRQFRDLAAWPTHNSPEQIEAMIAASNDLMAMSADPKSPACEELSRPVVQAVGRLMFDASWEPEAPVLWLGHDVVARRLAKGV